MKTTHYQVYNITYLVVNLTELLHHRLLFRNGKNWSTKISLRSSKAAFVSQHGGVIQKLPFLSMLMHISEFAVFVFAEEEFSNGAPSKKGGESFSLVIRGYTLLTLDVRDLVSQAV